MVVRRSRKPIPKGIAGSNPALGEGVNMKKYLILFAIIGILLFAGCTQHTKEGRNNSTGFLLNNESITQNNKSIENKTENILDLFNKGKKIECSYFINGTATTVYYEGNKAYVQYDSQYGLINMIVKGDYVYIPSKILPGLVEGCDWYKINTSSDLSNTDTTIYNFDYVYNNYKATCKLSDFDESLFDVNGKICTEEDVIKAMADKACASLPEPQKTQCYNEFMAQYK